ncbi:hypothetical protein FRC15_009528 [Serendipita sp. 397]|nr:hypothetical protein FRC15_009528 [Serendipita sp. 397]KAG8799654.1 hypothetical protein FRC16_004645 [Serendipita sp. 398]
MIDYSEFLHSNGALANDGGPWQMYRSDPDDINSGSMRPFWCGDVAYCLSAWVFPCASKYTYTVSFYTDVAVNLSQYEGLTTLQYEWQYSAWWGTSKAVPGTMLAIKSSVDGTTYNDTLSVGNYTQLFDYGTGWEGPPFKHNGSISLLPSTGRTTEHIHLAINLTFSRQTEEYINYYVKNVSFRVIAPPTAVPSSTLSTFPSTSSPITTSDSTSLPTLALSSSTSPTTLATTVTPMLPLNASKNLSVGAFVGGIIGAGTLVSLLMLGLFFCWGQRASRRNGGRVAMEEASTPRETIESPRIDPFNNRETEEDHTHPIVPLMLINNENASARGQDGSMISEQASPRTSDHRLSTVYTPYVTQVIGNPPAYVSSNSLARQHQQTEAGMSGNELIEDGHRVGQSTEESTGVSPGGRLTYTKQ